MDYQPLYADVSHITVSQPSSWVIQDDDMIDSKTENTHIGCAECKVGTLCTDYLVFLVKRCIRFMQFH